MGKTLLELFKNQKLSNGQTAAQKYEVQNSKENTPSNASGFMNGVVFPLQQIARRNLSNRTGETLIEEEVTGLRILNTIASPQIYGTDIIRLTTQKSNLTEIMLQSANGGTSDNGIIGNFIAKEKKEVLKLTSKWGIEFPVALIPTSLQANTKFNTGPNKGGEPDTMTTLAEIKKDGAGSLVGKFLAQNAKGTPKQIFNQVLGGGIDFLKSKIKKKLLGSPTQAGQNLAGKTETQVQYDSATLYSQTINLRADDAFGKNDLSSILVAQQTKDAGDIQVIAKVNELVPKSKSLDAKSPLNVIGNPFASIGDKVSSTIGDVQSGLSDARKEGQQTIAKDANKSARSGTDSNTTYEDIVDWSSDDIAKRNDLSTLYKAVIDTTAGKQTKRKYYSASPAGASTNGSTAMDVIRGITSNKGDFINSVGVFYGEDAKDQKGKLLDDYDFIALKFTSPIKGISANFRATITGLSETFTPSWDSAKFIGSPFPYYTYSQIERSVTFNFKVYSYNSKEHKKAWERLSFLANLTYPQNYSGTDSGNAITPPIITFTLGDLYHKKECFIDSLSYTIDDNTPWEIGLNGGDSQNYKLPMIVDVAITLKFLQSKRNTWGTGLYGASNTKPTGNVVTFNQQKTNTTTQNNPQPDASTNFTQKQPDGTTSNAAVTSNTTKVETPKPAEDPKGTFVENWNGYDLYYKKTRGPFARAFAYKGGSMTNQTEESAAASQSTMIQTLKLSMTP